MTVGMAIQTSHPSARAFRAPIFRLIELLLGKGGHQQPYTFDLLGIQNPVEYLKKVLNSDECAFRDIP